MFPLLLSLGPLKIHTYGLLFALGIFSGGWLMIRLAEKQGISAKKIFDLLFYTVLLSLIGAKLFLFITDFKYYSTNPGEIKNIIFSGGTFYGGLIFGIAFAVYYVRRHNLGVRILGDSAAPAIALGHFFGRLGCFFAGCCYGRPAAEGFMKITFTSHYAAGHTGVPLGIPLYPTQLMEAALNLLNFVILFTLYRHRRFPGQIFALYIFNYSVIRFVVEFFRGDPGRGYVFGGIVQPFVSLSVPQLISLGGMILAIFLYLVFRKKTLPSDHAK